MLTVEGHQLWLVGCMDTRYGVLAKIERMRAQTLLTLLN